MANGCLRVTPSSHRDHVLHPHLHEDRSDLTRNQRMADGTFDQATAVDLELQPGQMSLHDVFAQRPLWLLKGVDRSGRNDFRIGHPPRR